MGVARPLPFLRMSKNESSVEDTLSKKLKRKREEFNDQDGEESIPHKKHLSTADHEHVQPSTAGRRCGRQFFDKPCEQLAQDLLGCALFREAERGLQCFGRIVETEAYLGGEDKAAHSYNGKRTERNEAMYMPPGTAYVYSIYGMHCCFNISSQGDGAAVLIRALEPVGGMASMMVRRKGVKKPQDLCNGPAKLCQAMGIDKTCNKLDLVSGREMWVELPPKSGPGPCAGETEASKRIGVDYAEEWADELLRFNIKDCPFVSKRTAPKRKR